MLQSPKLAWYMEMLIGELDKISKLKTSFVMGTLLSSFNNLQIFIIGCFRSFWINHWLNVVKNEGMSTMELLGNSWLKDVQNNIRRLDID